MNGGEESRVWMFGWFLASIFVLRGGVLFVFESTEIDYLMQLVKLTIPSFWSKSFLIQRLASCSNYI